MTDTLQPVSGNASTHRVEPVIILASEYADYETNLAKKSEVESGVENFLSINRYVRDWYRHHVGKTYDLAPAKIVFSNLTAKEWLDLSELSR